MNISEKVIEILKELNAFEAVDENSSLTLDVGLDSLGMVTMLVTIEDSFQIELDESDMNPFELQTIGDVIHLVSKYLEGKDE